MPSYSRSRNNPQQENENAPVLDNPGWGTGLFGDLFSMGAGGLMNGTGTFGESMLDMGRNLSRSGAGTNETWGGTGGSRQYSSMDALGLGLGGYYGGHGLGAGLGGGVGEWSSQAKNDSGMTRSSSGYSGSLGGMLREDHDWSMGGESLATGAELYRGVGGNAYSFNESSYTDQYGNIHAGSQGYGVDGSYTPLGVSNTHAEYSGRLGQGGVSMEDAQFGTMRGGLEGGVTDDGTAFGRASWAPGRTEIRGVNGYADTALGQTDFGMGSFGTGPRYQTNFEANANGSVAGGAQWAGGGWAVNDAHLNHDFGGGVNVTSSVGEVNTANSWALNGGWDNEAKQLHADGAWSTGNTVRNANLGVGLPGQGGVNAHVGEYLDGNNITGLATLGQDGLHANGDAQLGGMELTNSSLDAGWEGMYYDQIGAKSISNRTLVQNANLDVNGNGINATVDSVRTGGLRVNGVEGRSDRFGTSTQYGLGEFSNDVQVDGARARIDGSGLHAGVQTADFGGVRVKDWHSETDAGRLGQLDTHMGKFTNGNTITNASADLTSNGLDVSAQEIGALGMDAENVGFNYAGPGGAHANAQLGSFHTGLNVKGFDGHAGLDGIDLNAKSASWDQYRVSDFNAGYGIPGLMESQLSLGGGHFNSFSGENLHAGLDESGLGLSGDNLAYSYLGLEELHASNNYLDGALGAELDLGRGSALGGSAEHLDYHTDLMNTSLAVQGLNAHGLQLEDVNVGANIGDLNAGVGLGEGGLLDLNVGSANMETQGFGTSGNANVRDAQLDLLRLDDASASLGWGDTTLIGAQADYLAQAGVDNASADWDLFSGTANANFENAHSSQQLSDASVNIGGMEVALPDMGYNANASGGGNVDLARGAANGNLSLAGSSVNFAGYEMELGDWAQASAGVDLSQGAVNANLGGDNGVGVNASLAEGNLDLNLFGNTIDVDQGIADAAGWVGDTASSAWDTVTSFLPSISLW